MMSADYEILIRFLLAILWGGLVGIEREYRNKSAGLRTMMMISMGSCFFTMMSSFLGGENNPDRIAANIVTGIGFLGAGVIFRSENKVTGITTSATIWTVAAVGMGIGAGHYFAAAIGSVFILIVLGLLTYGERVIEQFNASRTYSIDCVFSSEAKNNYQKHFLSCHLKTRLIKEVKEGDRLVLIWDAVGSLKNHELIWDTLNKDSRMNRLERH